MSKFEEAEIARIIHDCEELYESEGTLYDVIEYSNSAAVPSKVDRKSVLLSRYLNENSEINLTEEELDDEDCEDFEVIFEENKIKKQTLFVSDQLLKMLKIIF